MNRPPSPPILDRTAYRHRRIGDAARVLPVFGLALFLMPVLWAVGTVGASTARTGLYIFAAWAGLIVVARMLAYKLSDRDAAQPGDRGIP